MSMNIISEAHTSVVQRTAEPIMGLKLSVMNLVVAYAA